MEPERETPTFHHPRAGAATCLEKSEKRGVQAARNGPSPPPTPAWGPVAKPELARRIALIQARGGVEPGWAPAGEGRELLTPRIDERVRSLSHCGAVSFKTHFHRYWTGAR